jgi:hypothetical protein
MSYATYDFTESLNRVALNANDIERVLAAWGKGDGMGEDAGHYKWTADGVSDWSGGFLMLLKDGRYGYLTGWCDYTGWGCQDGAVLHEFSQRPTFAELKAVDEYDKTPPDAEWDVEPADLNRWLAVESGVSPTTR